MQSLTAPRSEYYLILNGSIAISCCEAMKCKLDKDWNVLVLRHTATPEAPVRHCGLVCVNPLVLTEI